jgi:5-methylcytosine-specific restriction enzyme subunit McrC
MIPVQNIYFLLCYAWDKLEEKEIVKVNEESSTDLLDLFSRVLINGINHLLKRGLDRYYLEDSRSINGIKGKLNLEETLKGNLLLLKKTNCTFDEFSFNILHNQIIKTTIFKLLRIQGLDIDIKNQLLALYQRLPKEIETISVFPGIYKKIRLHRNNHFYDFLLKICELINNGIFIEKGGDNYKFKDFEQDEKKMRLIFETFVRNFYKIELPKSEFKVTRENIKWQLKSNVPKAQSFLPIMQTDISIETINRKIIIDTKYYKETLKGNFNTEKIHSSNLYQLFSYLKNVEYKDEISKNCEGILLYPTIEKELNLQYQMDNHKISIRTINLNQHRAKIKDELLSIISPLN